MSFVLLSGYNALSWIAGMVGWRVGATLALATIGRSLLRMAVRNYGGPIAYLPEYLTNYVVNRATPTLLLVGTGNVAAGISVRAAYLVIQGIGTGAATSIIRLTITGVKTTIYAVAEGAKMVANTLPNLLAQQRAVADAYIREDMKNSTEYFGEWEVVSTATAQKPNVQGAAPVVGDSILLQCSVEEAEAMFKSINHEAITLPEDELVNTLENSVKLVSSEPNYPELDEPSSSIEWTDADNFGPNHEERIPLQASYLTNSWISIDVKPPSAPPISFVDDMGSRLLNDGEDAECRPMAS